MQTKNWQRELKERLSKEYVENVDREWVELNISSSGLVNSTIISDRLKDLSISDRKQQVKNILNDFHVSSGFMSVYTVDEANLLKLSRSQPIDSSIIHTWQDLALWAANSQLDRESVVQLTPRIPHTVTFYSFKGGVGRTIALTHVAWILAERGHKVVAVDLDLEAPGLSTAFKLMPQPQYGIVDYFYERAYLPDGSDASIAIGDIFGEVNIPDASGRLFVVPAGVLSLDYISKVDDLRATTVSDRGETLWSIFKREIDEQIKPDIILVDSRTGINQWGALSLLEAADSVLIFLFPNEQNQQGIDLLLKSLNSIGKLSINFVFSPVPDTTEIGMNKLKSMWQILNQSIEDRSNIDYSDIDDESEPLIIPYLTPIATADRYPVTELLDYYQRITNAIDLDTDRTNPELNSSLKNIDRRWELMKSLKFPPLNAGDPQQNLSDLFQKTANFDKFLDPSTCLIKGRKGTGKTALYLLLLKHSQIAKSLAHGRLEKVTFLSGHGGFDPSRPSRNEFEVVHRALSEQDSNWESFWRAYLLIKVSRDSEIKLLSIIKGDKFRSVRDILKLLPKDNWQSDHTKSSIRLSTENEFKLLIPDAIELLHRDRQSNDVSLWFLYDDLDEDFPDRGGIRKQALTGLFQLIQSCDARRLTSIRFKVFLREDIWNRLNFDNKSHFNGRDLILKWTRVDFLRLALRQAMQSPDFKALIDRSSPIENIDTANEENLSRALEPLWGIRRRAGDKAKFVSRWVYERLTDSSGTSFPRSLSALMEGAKNHELTYEGQTSVQTATDDRLLRAKSLEIGLEHASNERCDAIRQEYPDLGEFFDALEGLPALLPKEQLAEIWHRTATEMTSTSEEFATLLSEIGISQWQEKQDRYKFADIYVYGFKMNRVGTR